MHAMFALLVANTLFIGCRKANDRLSNVVIHHDSVSNSDWVIDTAQMTITVNPVYRDNSPQLQQVIKYQGHHPGYVIMPSAGNF